MREGEKEEIYREIRGHHGRAKFYGWLMWSSGVMMATVVVSLTLSMGFHSKNVALLALGFGSLGAVLCVIIAFAHLAASFQ